MSVLDELRTSGIAIYHVSFSATPDLAACNNRVEGDKLVSVADVTNPDLKVHFNCPMCDQVMRHGLRHALAPGGHDGS